MPGPSSCDKGGVRRAISWLVACVALLPGEAASAERALWVGGGPSYFSLDRPPYSGSTAGLHLGARYLLTDQFSLLGELTAAPHFLRRAPPDPCPEPPALCEESDFGYSVLGNTLSLGAVYVLDTTRLSPHAGAMVGLSRLGVGDGIWQAARGVVGQELSLTLVLALGADYQLDERWSVGLALRQHMLAGDAELLQATAQVQYRLW